jgi:alpha-L-arabinofuranosidase
MHPRIFRFPGGNYVEGVTVGTRWNWKQTIGPVWERPGHQNSAWGYWSDDGLGLLEYLQLAEDLAASPVMAVWAGLSLNGTVVAQADLAPYVQDALDQIEYATGPVTSTWGARRAADGHPAPTGCSRCSRATWATGCCRSPPAPAACTTPRPSTAGAARST